NAPPQLVGAAQDAVDFLGFAGEDALHQIARAYIEEGRVLHRPGEPRLAGLARGHHFAFREDQFRWEIGGALHGGVVADGAAGQRTLHARHEFPFRNRASRGSAQTGGEIRRLALAERFGDHGDVVGHFAFDARNGEAEFVHGVDVFRVRQRGAVGVAGAFEPAVVRALTGVRDHHGRPARAETFGGQAVGVSQLAWVVTVGFDHVPAQGKPVVNV